MYGGPEPRSCENCPAPAPAPGFRTPPPGSTLSGTKATDNPAAALDTPAPGDTAARGPHSRRTRERPCGLTRPRPTRPLRPTAPPRPGKPAPQRPGSRRPSRATPSGRLTCQASSALLPGQVCWARGLGSRQRVWGPPHGGPWPGGLTMVNCAAARRLYWSSTAAAAAPPRAQRKPLPCARCPRLAHHFVGSHWSGAPWGRVETQNLASNWLL